MANTLPLIIQMGALPLNFQGTPQQFADAIAARLAIVTQQAYALFVTGSTEPSSNVGPWLDQSTTIGIWKGWDDVQGNYQPLPVSDSTLKYILSATEPDPTVFQLWVKLNGAGKALGAYTYYANAWHDIYEDVIATLNAAIAAVLPTAGDAGTVLTSAGPGNPPVWQNQFFPGVIIDYAGSTVPPGLPWLICDGSLKAIVSYQNLFSAIGTTFGGDGLTTFAVPDLRGRGRAGLGTGTYPTATPWSLGEVKGAETHTLTTSELPSHTHDIDAQRISADGNVGNPAGAIMGFPNGSIKVSNAAGSDQAHNNLQPTMGLNALIRY